MFSCPERGSLIRLILNRHIVAHANLHHIHYIKVTPFLSPWDGKFISLSVRTLSEFPISAYIFSSFRKSELKSQEIFFNLKSSFPLRIKALGCHTYLKRITVCTKILRFSYQLPILKSFKITIIWGKIVFYAYYPGKKWKNLNFPVNQSAHFFP